MRPMIIAGGGGPPQTGGSGFSIAARISAAPRRAPPCPAHRTALAARARGRYSRAVRAFPALVLAAAVLHGCQPFDRLVRRGPAARPAPADAPPLVLDSDDDSI